jgi:hypothetical protein
MAPTFTTKRKGLPDEVFEPELYKDGKYRVQIKVDALAEVYDLALKGASVRVRGKTSNQINLKKMD